MQNGRNVSSDDNKNAISLDNIIDEYGTGTKRNDTKLGDAMKKLDEMFNQEEEDLAWLNNIMNSGVTGSSKDQSAQQEAPIGNKGMNNASKQSIIRPDEIMIESAAQENNATAVNTVPDLGDMDEDFIPETIHGTDRVPTPGNIILPDLSVMPGEDEPQKAEKPSEVVLDDDIFSDSTDIGNDSAADEDISGQQYEEVIRAENADDDDTKIFAPGTEKINIPDAPEDFSEWENTDNAGIPAAMQTENTTGGAVNGDMYAQAEMQGYSMMNTPAPIDKKLEKKRRKEEKKFAKAQAKLLKEQQKAKKNAAYMYNMPQQSAPDMYANYNTSPDQQIQEVPNGVPQNAPTFEDQQNIPMQNAPSFEAQQNIPMQNAPSFEAQQNAPMQNAPSFEAQQEAPATPSPEAEVQNNAPMPEDDVKQYNGESAINNGTASDNAIETHAADMFRENENTAEAEAVFNTPSQDAGTAQQDIIAPQTDTTAPTEAPDFDMFEGAQSEGEYVHNIENAALQQENNVDSSLGKLFGVDIPDDNNDSKKNAKKKSEHKKIAKELGAYEEINMADPNAVNNARKLYFTQRRRSMISLFGAALFLLVSLYAELSMLGVFPVPDIINAKTNPTMFALADLQIMCFGAMFVLESLISGFYSLLDRRFSPASCALTVFIACTVQAVISAVFGEGIKIQMFCCVGCLAMFMLALYDSLRASADFKSFNIASSTANKYGAYDLGVDSLECSPFAAHIDLEKAKVISVNKGSVYEGFVGRNEKRPEGEKKLGRLTLIITLISLFVGAFVALFSDGNITERVYDGITGAAIVITSSVPLNVFFVSALPKYLAVKKGSKLGATLIGQNASEEYKGLSVVAFEDTEVFLPKDVRISSIKTYGGMALDEAVITMANIYNKIGGPLSKIFAKMVDVKSMRSEVRLVKVYPDAIEVNVDGRDFCLATASYLGANGIRIINDGVDAAFEQSHGSILFMVCSGRVLSKFYIKYSMNPIFEKTLRELHDANLCIGIKTLDPCITNDLVFGCLERANYALSVIKGNSAGDIPVVRNKVNSGVISLGSVHSFLEMLLICEKTGRNVKINNVIKLISAILCIALSTVFVLTNNGSLNIIFCLIIQLFWLLPVAAVSYLNR